MDSGRPILLTVRVIYLPGKAAIFYPGGLGNALKFLLADLTSLSLPHPEESNVRILLTGVLELYWETTEGSTLHHTLVRKLASPSKDWSQSLTGQLIHSMTYQQEVDKTLKDITSTQLDSGNYKRVCVKRKGRQRIPSLSTPDCPPTTSGTALSTSSAEVAEFSPTSLHTSTNATPSREPTAPPSSAPVSPKDVTSTEDAPACQSHTEGAIETESGLKPSLSHEPASLLLPLSQCSAQTSLSTNNTPTSTEEMAPSHTAKRTWCPESASTPPPAKRVYHEQEVTRLMQELEHLNQEVVSLAARQAEIRGKLQDAGATDIPALDSSAESFASRIRLRALEVEIETERQKRLEYELVLGDIRRECKVPFIVPSLLDAFIEVSKLTNAAVKP
ncbi:hypothetical protein ARMSODRAFT_1006235 [Armillaria solidipes]|uniref:Uncharacterized protein n=1 Tax=Armillaria solidipes TaxID=1076256 RepID=A0A2H3B5I9_9AGAR|nr:hypothetical protein ARMSODRAFT_1006235 [Armillaria solidipes]